MSSRIETKAEYQAIENIFRKGKTPELTTDLPAHEAWFKIDSKDRNRGVNGETVTSVAQFNVGQRSGQLQGIGVNKLRVGFINFPWLIPNVNPRNSGGQFFHTDGTVSTFNVAEGMYDLDDFIVALKTALDAAVPAYGVWTITKGAKKDCFAMSITTTGGTWVPDFTTNVVGQRRSIWEVAGMYNEKYSYPADLATAKTSIYEGNYTRYVDVTSSDINQYERLINQSSHNPASDLVVRIFADARHDFFASSDIGTGPPASRCHYVQFSGNDKYITWEESRTFGENIDMNLLDDQGDRLYLGADPLDYPDWQLSFVLSSKRGD